MLPEVGQCSSLIDELSVISSSSVVIFVIPRPAAAWSDAVRSACGVRSPPRPPRPAPAEGPRRGELEAGRAATVEALLHPPSGARSLLAPQPPLATARPRPRPHPPRPSAFSDAARWVARLRGAAGASLLRAPLPVCTPRDETVRQRSASSIRRHVSRVTGTSRTRHGHVTVHTARHGTHGSSRYARHGSARHGLARHRTLKHALTLIEHRFNPSRLR